MQTWSNNQTDHDIRAVRRNNVRLYDDLRKSDEDAAFDAYQDAKELALQLRYEEITVADAGMTLKEAEAQEKARYREWRELIASH
ncbi:MAG TPA: hypothetical protein PK890_07020 [Terrimesophilobacter sp.]|nr:hypothetical protein [Terrimesophilobacter sp.]